MFVGGHGLGVWRDRKESSTSTGPKVQCLPVPISVTRTSERTVANTLWGIYASLEISIHEMLLTLESTQPAIGWHVYANLSRIIMYAFLVRTYDITRNSKHTHEQTRKYHEYHAHATYLYTKSKTNKPIG